MLLDSHKLLFIPDRSSCQRFVELDIFYNGAPSRGLDHFAPLLLLWECGCRPHRFWHGHHLSVHMADCGLVWIRQWLQVCSFHTSFGLVQCSGMFWSYVSIFNLG